MKSLYTKIVSGFLIVSIVAVGFFSLSVVEPVYADGGGKACAGGAVVALGQYVIAKVTGSLKAGVGTEGTGQKAVDNWTQASNRINDCVLKPLAQMMIVALIRNIGSSIVNWVNSGFEGKPLFVTDFEGTLLNSADQAIGNFIETKTDLGFLCSSFSFQIRLALALKYSQPFNDQVRCTLTDITKNVNNFVNNNGYVGWDNWLAVTTNPNNNVYGAYLSADTELAQRAASAVGVKQNRISLGQGFLDYEVCDQWETDSQVQARLSGASGGPAQVYNTSNALGTFQSNASSTKKFVNSDGSGRQCIHKTTATPGKLVADQLNNEFMQGPIQQAVATEIDQVISATLNQLALKVVQGARGLLGLSQKSQQTSGSSYLDQYRAQFYGQTTTAGQPTTATVNADTGASSEIDNYAVNSYDEAAALRNDPTNSTIQGINSYTDTVGGAQITADQNQLNAVQSAYDGTVSVRDIALAKVSSESSVLNDASYGNDGIKQISQYLKGAETSPYENGGWWQVDLGSDSQIDSINIYKNPTPSQENGGLGTFTVKVTDSAGNSTEYPASNFAQSASDANLLSGSIGRVGRYVRITRTQDNSDGFCSWSNRYSDAPACFSHLAFAELEVMQKVDTSGLTASTTPSTAGTTTGTSAPTVDNRTATSTLSWTPSVSSGSVVSASQSMSQTATLSTVKSIDKIMVTISLYNGSGTNVPFSSVFNNFDIFRGSGGSWTSTQSSFSSTTGTLEVNLSMNQNSSFSFKFVGDKQPGASSGNYSFISQVVDSTGAVLPDKTQRIDFVVQ